MRRKNAILCLLLLPFALAYRLATEVRNMLFDLHILPSERFPAPVICVGNISAGGTGKTPFTEYLIRLLKKQYRVAVLSRGYKRETKGFVIAAENGSARETGDESCQIKRKFPDVIVAVDANRRRGIRRLLALPAGDRPEVILLDDAMQHRYVLPSLTIMLTEYGALYYDDYMLPVGNLRESAYAVSRADIVVVTKCGKDIKPIALRIVEKNMSLMANQRLYFSGITYHSIEPLFPSNDVRAVSLAEISGQEEILLIAGIANPQPLMERLSGCFRQIQICKFPDHHAFTPSDIRTIDEKFRRLTSSSRRMICTEKDAMRLKSLDCLPAEWKSCLYYLPISIDFTSKHKDSFDTRILNHVMSTINIQQKK